MARRSPERRFQKGGNGKRREKKVKNWTSIILLGATLVIIFSFLVYFKGGMEKEKYHPPARKPVKKKVKTLKLPEKKIRSKVAIIIDDLGYNYEFGQSLLDIDAAITFSILPFTSHSVSIAKDAHTRGREVILHLPMEPNDNLRPDIDNNFILTTMSKEELTRRLNSCLESFPYISGVNNHMGSRFTEDSSSMRIVLENLKQKKLFFLDSRTTPNTVAFSLAKEMGVKTAERDVFLDNAIDIDTIKAKINELVDVSLTDGSAIGIGHPHPATLKALKEMVPQLKARGIEIVSVSELVE